MNNSAVKKERNSSVEILRIIAMLLIIISHFSAHGVNDSIKLYEMDSCFNKYLLETIPLGALGVDIFMIITGYFGVKSTFKAEKLIRLVLQVFFYSVAFFWIFTALGLIDFSVKDAVFSFFPTITRKYWFFTSYIMVYVLSPLINRLLCFLNRKQHLILIVALMLIYRVFSAITGIGFLYSNLIIVYITGAYLRLYPDNILSNKKYCVLFFIGSMLFTFGSVAAINIAAQFMPSLAAKYSYFYNREFINILLAAASIFMIFKTIEIGEKKLINTVSVCTFGVYLIHDNEFFRPILWNNIVHAPELAYSKLLFLIIPITAVLIFISCTAIEFIRQKIIEKPVMILVNKICDTIRAKVKK